MAPVTEGFISFNYRGKTYQTYYKVVGDLAHRINTPLIALHGGPGLSHDYLSPIADLAEAEIPVILYDQIGNARSTHLPNQPRDFWSIDLFVEELENLLKFLNIHDDFSLLGHSWGGVLAAEFEVRKQPAGLKKLVITNSLASASLWGQANILLVQNFPKEVKEGLMRGMENPKAYHAALKEFHAHHGCLLKPVPAEVEYSLGQVFGDEGDPTVASAGILDDWTIIERLHLVRVPTFVINGRKDIAQDFVVAPFFHHIPQVKWVTFERSSHMPFWEEREHYNELVGEFLKSRLSRD